MKAHRTPTARAQMIPSNAQARDFDYERNERKVCNETR